MRHKQSNKSVPRHFLRKIHFGDEVWTYRVTSMCVLIREPDPTKLHQVDLSDITGMWPHDIERGMWKRWWKGIGPGEIREHIEFQLWGDPAMILPSTVLLDMPLTWRRSRWHLSPFCSLRGSLQESFTPEEAAKHLKSPVTRRNLCGACRMLQVRKVA